MWRTLSDVVLSSVSELDSLVLTGGSTGWDGGSVETLGGGDLDLDSRVTCSSQQVLSTHERIRVGGGMSGAGQPFSLTATQTFFSTISIDIDTREVLRWIGRVGEATYLESRRSNNHQQLFQIHFFRKLRGPQADRGV